MTKEELVARMPEYRLRKIAREFASRCRRDNLAYKFPDELLDGLSDEDALLLVSKYLPEAGLRQQPQSVSFWESTY